MVGDGSGCFFQPMTEEYTYILTARHLFCDRTVAEGVPTLTERVDGQQIIISRNTLNNGTWQSIQFPLTLTRGQTYFPLPNADAAILKVQFLNGLDQLLIDPHYERPASYKLCGYPSNRRNAADQYTSYELHQNIASGNFGQTAQLAIGTLTQDNLEGMSGGGILKPEEHNILIIGVQSKMLSTVLPAGQIGFVPMKFFEEIIATNANLEKLMPVYLKSFSYFGNEIFALDYGLDEQQIAEQLTTLLKTQATRVINSNINPIEVRNYFKEKLMFILTKQNPSDLDKKKLWIAWLEMLTILNVAHNHQHAVQDLPNLEKKIRLFYSDTDRDFFIAHLDHLDQQNYSGLEAGGVVIVSSNSPAKGGSHVLNRGLGRIDQMRKEYQIKALSIDNATEFPLDKYKFINISAFKEGCIVDNYTQFENLTAPQIISKLKEQYELLFKP